MVKKIQHTLKIEKVRRQIIKSQQAKQCSIYLVYI